MTVNCGLEVPNPSEEGSPDERQDDLVFGF